MPNPADAEYTDRKPERDERHFYVHGAERPGWAANLVFHFAPLATGDTGRPRLTRIEFGNRGPRVRAGMLQLGGKRRDVRA